MEWVETTGKSVEAAKDAALDRLGVDLLDAEFEVIEDAKTGLFGRIKQEARVRARVKPVAPRPKAPSRRRKPSKGRGGPKGGGGGGQDRARTQQARGQGGGQGAGQGGGQGGQRGQSDRKSQGGGRSRGQKQGQRSDGEGQNAGERQAASAAAAATGGQQSGRDNDQKDRDNNRTTKQEGTRVQEQSSTDEDLTIAVQADMTASFLEGLVEAFDYKADVAVSQIDDETMQVDVDGSDLGLLVGPKGSTLRSIQELSRTVVQRQATGRLEGRVRVDVAGYRERRRVALAGFTEKVAADVVATGSEKSLEPMGAADRKIVHDVAGDIDGVDTLSEGEEPRRYVVIIPAGS